jgi:Zn-dependent M28 family amino/carboxypeptidase
MAGRSLDAAYEEAARREFYPYTLSLHASVRVENNLRTLQSNNFLARLDGEGDECIVYNAHWDHLGVGKAVDGDSIYNGALDNASGVAGMLEVARLFGERKSELKRSVLFLIPTAEESGLLGAYYYTDHPTVPLTKTVAMINVDGLNVWGRTEDMVVVGYGQSELDAILEGVLGATGREVVPDTEPEKGFYYRSDHFAFAKKGVPALYADSGVDVLGKPDGWGMEQRRLYNEKYYHTPDDEYDPSWDFTGAAEDMMALFRVGFKLATTGRWPQWSAGSEFKSVREESLQGER